MANITEKKRVLEVRWAGCLQEEPAHTVGLGEKPAAKLGTLFLGNRPNRPLALLGEQDSFWIPSGGERAMHTLSNL